MSTSKTHVRGRIDVHPRGFGFLVIDPPEPAGTRSAFIPPPAMAGFLADDVVTADLTQGSDGRFTAGNLVLAERRRTRIFGEIAKRDGKWKLRPDPVVGTGEWALDVNKLSPSPRLPALARIDGQKLVLERLLDPEADHSLDRVVVRHDLFADREPEAMAEVPAIVAKPHAAGSRRDLRDIPTITVDAPSTRDIDDAISVLPADPDGGLRVLVSIADVSEFVPENSALDRSALARATSVYLANRVLPMLPEELSSVHLSLLPEVDRLCLTAELRIDPEGHVTATDVYESIIRSHARCDYDEVAAYLDRGVVSERLARVKTALPWFRAASARLGLERLRRGGISLDSEDARLTFDPATGEVSGIESVATNSAHQLIERYMVAANEAVATWLSARGVPAPFRTQPRPDPQRIADFELFAQQSGFVAAFGHELSPVALAAFERQLEGCTAEAALKAVLRRTLGPARYTARAVPHFTLAAAAYVHFTSPIRRYADLITHRRIKTYLHGRRDFVPGDPATEAACEHINARARAAKRAEDDRRRMLEARYLGEKLGEEREGRVTRVKPFGLMVQLDGTLVEGTVPAESLPGGPWRADERETTLQGDGRSFTIGQPMRVKLVSTDQALGRIEFAYAGEP